MSPEELIGELGKTVNPKLAEQLVQEYRSQEEAFLLKKWKYTELDGGRFTEAAARILYSVDSGNINLGKTVVDCVRYVDNDQVPHNFPERHAAIHLSKVIKATYKLRSQRGAVHVSATYTANEIDSRLIISNVRWILAELLRLFISGNDTEVAQIIHELAQFPHPVIREFDGLPLLQKTDFTTEEEILAHLLYSKDRSLKTADLLKVVQKDGSGIRRALKKLSGSKVREIVDVNYLWHITDRGIMRIEGRLTTSS
jgi:hypothetical protein